MSVDHRIETDPLGPVNVRSDRYYGAQTARAIDNFPISGITINRMPHVVEALARVKMAAAQANYDEGLLADVSATRLSRLATRYWLVNTMASYSSMWFRAARAPPRT
ncbi:hypothetical protein [Mesorhizobium carmichaelinearum]|uniref:hypothetical protein n=1 Tax=Mesorhizobium carmichaelinearum TaxID=1208188 RepID=UPI0011804294|nr:hypothetical protein [Mesorhizobium carmichaelinearum]